MKRLGVLPVPLDGINRWLKKNSFPSPPPNTPQDLSVFLNSFPVPNFSLAEEENCENGVSCLTRRAPCTNKNIKIIQQLKLHCNCFLMNFLLMSSFKSNINYRYKVPLKKHNFLFREGKLFTTRRTDRNASVVYFL